MAELNWKGKHKNKAGGMAETFRQNSPEEKKFIKEHGHKAKEVLAVARKVATRMKKKLSPEQEFEREQKRLTDTHLRAIGKRKADAYNIGWASGDNFITSKTSKGRITTQRAGKKYSHKWHDED